MPNYKMPEITKEDLLKINICVAHAQCKNREKPGTYAYELNKVLKANNLPNIIIPEDTDTKTVFARTTRCRGNWVRCTNTKTRAMKIKTQFK